MLRGLDVPGTPPWLRPPARRPQDHWPREPVIPVKAHPLRVCKIPGKDKDQLMLLLCARREVPGTGKSGAGPRRGARISLGRGGVKPYDGSVESPGYLRFPHITGDLAVFIAADDVWLAPVAGGRAWRFTSDEAQASTPRLSPDGTHVAWVSAKDGSPEIYVASLTDGTSTRLTYWGTHWARVSSWTPAGEVLAVTAANQPFRHYVRARALTTVLSGSPGAERVLPFGPVSDLSLGTDA